MIGASIRRAQLAHPTMQAPSPPDLDPSLFPETVEYLASLGNDLDALPKCTTKSDFFEDLVREFPTLVEEPSLSPRLRTAFDHPWRRQEWMPSILVVALLTMVRDHVHTSDEAFLNWNFERQLRIYQRPIFRALMFVLSPTLLFMGAARRWNNFHLGSTLNTRGDKSRAELELTFPEHAYSRVFLISLVAAFRASLHSSKAQDPVVEVQEISSTRARYLVHWR